MIQLQCSHFEKYLTMDSTRNIYLDEVKAIAIFLVIMGHVAQHTCMLSDPSYDFVVRVIYTFHMPLFMGVCGYFFSESIKKRGYNGYIKNRFYSRFMGLLCPMIVFGLLKIVVLYLLGDIGMPSIRDITKSVYNVWFLGNLLGITVIMMIVLKFCNGKFSYDVWILLLGCAFFVIPKVFYEDSGLIMYIFFIIGYCIDSYYKNSRLFLLVKYTPIIFIFYIISMSLYDCFYATNMSIIQRFLFDIYRICNGILGCWIALSFTWKINYYIKSKWVIERILYAGRFTLDIYLIQIILLEIIGRIFYKKIVEFTDVNILSQYGVLSELILCFIISLAILEVIFIISRYINMNKFLSKVLFYR